MDFPDQTQKPAAPEPEKKLKPITSDAKLVKRSVSRRFFDFVFAESPKDVAARVAKEVIMPQIKIGLEQAGNGFMAGMLWGDGANRPQPLMNRAHVLRAGGSAYSSLSAPVSPLQQARAAAPQPSGGNYQDVVFPDQALAENALAQLYMLLNEYNRVSVADLYEIAGISSGISDNAYGWTALEGVRISKTRDGFVLELPRPSIVN